MIRKKHKWISEIDGKPIIASTYYLSPEEQSHLRGILKGYEEQKVDAFMRSLEIYVDYTRRILDRLSFKDRATHRDGLFQIRAHCVAAYNDILKISSGRFQILPPRQCDSSNWNVQDTENPRVKIVREIAFSTAILSTREYLLNIINNLTLALEIDRAKQGEHYKADEFLLGSQIAQSFKKYIDKPRPYSGAFPVIIDYCFDIVGIKGNDRTRAIRQALKRFCPAYTVKPV